MLKKKYNEYKYKQNLKGTYETVELAKYRFIQSKDS